MPAETIRELRCRAGKLEGERADLLVVPVLKGSTEPPAAFRDALGENSPLRLPLESGDFRGDLAQTTIVYGASGAFPRALLLGLGEAEAINREKLRGAVATAARQARDLGAASVILPLPLNGTAARSTAEEVELAAEAAILGAYRFDGSKKPDPEKDRSIGSWTFLVGPAEDAAAAEAALERGRVRAEGVSFARDLGNTPANLLTPSDLADVARRIAEEEGLRLRVLEAADAEREGLGAFLGVAQGSRQPPKFLLLEYDAGRSGAPKIGIIGKGITFDSGGISLKPPAKMEEMKFDMCGAAAILGTMKVVRRLGVPVDVVAAVPACENMPGPEAMKPGDVRQSYSGKTVEVLNTDAEGRLILADALTYVARNYRPAAMVDLATLTGAVVIALGHYGAAVLSNDDDLASRIAAASERSGELTWRLPIWEAYPDHLKSRVADLKNVADPNAGGGTIAGGAFLREFVEGLPWAHIDIAGTAWWDRERAHIPKGASGYGVRLLTELLGGYAR